MRLLFALSRVGILELLTISEFFNLNGAVIRNLKPPDEHGSGALEG